MNQPFMIDETGKQVVIPTDSDIFCSESVLLTAEKYAKNFYISVTKGDGNNINLTLTSKDGSVISETIIREAMNDIVDFQIRISLEKEFGDLKKRIVDYAFASVENRR